jgi:hypothetical protein
VHALRHALNRRNAALIEEMVQIRDVLSHTATGKDETFLQLNQTSPGADHAMDGSHGVNSSFKSEASVHSTLYPRYRRTDSVGAPDIDGSPLHLIFERAWTRALGGGLPGALAMGAQVGTLMWLRTTMNYQYRYGTSTINAVKHLYAVGGVRRFYKGLGFALILGPLGRFGDTAANTGVLYALDSIEPTREIGSSAKSMVAASAAAGWRILLMPLDACKTVMQVEGGLGLQRLWRKCGLPSAHALASEGHLAGDDRGLSGQSAQGRSGDVPGSKNRMRGQGSGLRTLRPSVLWHGSCLHFSATFVGHYTWFFVFNALNAYLPDVQDLRGKLLRNASVGFLASLASDATTNSLRVAKTVRQTHRRPVSHREAVEIVVDAARTGRREWAQLFTRGLVTRLLANGLQGALFTCLWKMFEEDIVDWIAHEEDGFEA